MHLFKSIVVFGIGDFIILIKFRPINIYILFLFCIMSDRLVILFKSGNTFFYFRIEKEGKEVKVI